MTDPLRGAAESAESTGGARAPAAPRDVQARWLFELERAQLARHSRQQNAGTAPATPAENSFETRAAPRNTQQAATAAQRRGGERAQSEAKGGSGLAAPGNATALGTRGTQSQERPFAGQARIGREELAKGPTLPAPRQAARLVPVTWPKVNVHAAWNDGELQVWVRDASLDESAQQRLAVRLRAQLRNLGRLTVNGETIYQEEGIAWPSKR